MSALRGNPTVLRFRVKGELPATELRTKFVKHVRARVFIPIDPEGEEELSVGWCSPLNDEDLDLGPEKVFFGERVYLAIRQDRLKPSAAALKRVFALRLAEQERETGTALGRRERNVLKHAVARELRQRLVPQTRTAQAVWDLSAHKGGVGRLYLFAASKWAVEALLELFVKTFGLELESEGAVTWVRDEVSSDAIDRLRPALFAAGTEGPEPDRGRVEYCLGREFLCWLIFHSGDADGLIEDFGIAFGEKVTFQSIAGPVTDVVLKGDAPAGSDDARVALAGGLSPREAELVVTSGDDSFALVLTEGFALKRVRLPVKLAPVEGDEVKADRADDVLADRMGLLERLDSLIWRAFRHFLALRTSELWTEQTLPDVRSWLEWGAVDGASEQA
jgi:DNA recombination-dependent growth factor C